MATADTNVRSGSVKLWTGGLKAGAAAVLVLIIAALGFAVFGDGATREGTAPAVDSQVSSRQEMIRELTNRGLVPEQALQPTPRSQDEIMRDLANLGLIPKQSLDRARFRETTCDLVNRGLIPSQAVSDPSVCAAANR